MSSGALLVMDVQEAIVQRFGDEPGYLERMDLAISAAREAGVPVVYVVVGFRPGHPEVSPRNKTFTALASGSAFTGADPAARIHPAIAPGPGDLVVTKRRVSAFAGSDLDVLLRGLDAGTLVLSGIATSGVVLSTLRQAADLDYGLTVLSDCCLDADQEVHKVLTEKVFPRQADVMTVAEWTSLLETGRWSGSSPSAARTGRIGSASPAATWSVSNILTFTYSGSTQSTALRCSTSSHIFVSSAREAKSGSQLGRAS
jgi:nicotinamidase-related amidase